MTTKINLTALAAKVRSVAPKVALAGLVATAASIAVTALVKESEGSEEQDIVETTEEA